MSAPHGPPLSAPPLCPGGTARGAAASAPAPALAARAPGARAPAAATAPPAKTAAGAAPVGVAIPVYNASASVAAVVEGVLGYLAGAGLPARVALVDDGSSDGSGAILDGLARAHPQVMAVHLTGNCGQQAALLCALRVLEGCRAIITMDDDLQHPAPVIGQLLQKLSEGYDLAYAIPANDARGPCRRLGSRLRDGVFRLLLHAPPGVRVGAFRAMRGGLAARVAAEEGPYVYLSASCLRYTRRVANLPFEQPPRPYGRSGYTLPKLCGVWLRLFLYYTLPGKALRRRGCPYQIRYMTGGGSPV